MDRSRCSNSKSAGAGGANMPNPCRSLLLPTYRVNIITSFFRSRTIHTRRRRSRTNQPWRPKHLKKNTLWRKSPSTTKLMTVGLLSETKILVSFARLSIRSNFHVAEHIVRVCCHLGSKDGTYLIIVPPLLAIFMTQTITLWMILWRRLCVLCPLQLGLFANLGVCLCQLPTTLSIFRIFITEPYL